VDASLSIKKDRLEQFKAGVMECLNHLNPERFFLNIAVFKEDTTLFSPVSVAATRKISAR